MANYIGMSGRRLTRTFTAKIAQLREKVKTIILLAQKLNLSELKACAKPRCLAASRIKCTQEFHIFSSPFQMAALKLHLTFIHHARYMQQEKVFVCKFGFDSLRNQFFSLVVRGLPG